MIAEEVFRRMRADLTPYGVEVERVLALAMTEGVDRADGRPLPLVAAQVGRRRRR